MADRQRRDRWGVVVAGLMAGAVAACTPAPRAGAPAAPPPTLQEPALRAFPLPSAAPVAPDPLAGITSLQTITLRAQDVEIRALLTALAESAGISLVLDPSIQGRMSVHLVDVPVAEALREVLAAANLSVVTPAAPAPWGPAIFYAVPVDIDRADAATIAARFGVSPELARLIAGDR